MNEFFNSVELIPNAKYSVSFRTTDTIFYEDGRIAPLPVGDTGLQIMPWGADNLMPYKIIDRIQADETMSTCQAFNAEICYGAGLQYDAAEEHEQVQAEVQRFVTNNDFAHVYMGQCQDLKHFGFSIVVLVLDREGKHITNIARKEVCNCRFSVADKRGNIASIVYADWQRFDNSLFEVIPLLSRTQPLADLQNRIDNRTKDRKFAVVSRIPTVDSTYYPIPYYGSLFRSKWYDIKQLIATAKFAKLKNAAPLKYQIEISQKYWDHLFAAEGITDLLARKKRVAQEKQQIVEFLTGAENSGKALFSTFYINPNGEEQHEIQIKKIDDAKEGGDWESDVQEAINIMCFTMGVHSNLVGSVPGKAQSNNSGSDKRELYTIAQTRQKPYHDLLFKPHQVVCAFNGWSKTRVRCPFLMLTTLDEHTDAVPVETA